MYGCLCKLQESGLKHRIASTRNANASGTRIADTRSEIALQKESLEASYQGMRIATARHSEPHGLRRRQAMGDLRNAGVSLVAGAFPYAIRARAYLPQPGNETPEGRQYPSCGSQEHPRCAHGLLLCGSRPRGVRCRARGADKDRHDCDLSVCSTHT